MITKFNIFINEELSPNIYKSASDKLDQLGHKERAKRLKDHIKDNTDNTDDTDAELKLPVKFIYKDYLLSPNDIDIVYVPNVEHNDPFFEMNIDKMGLQILCYINSMTIQFIKLDEFYDEEFIDYKFADRKSANNFVKILKNKIKNLDIKDMYYINMSKDEIKKLHYLFNYFLNNLTPNIFYTSE